MEDPRRTALKRWSARPTHLVSGATGFVGGALVLELLRRTDDPICAVVRATGRTARQRFHDALAHASQVYGVALDPGDLDRCRVVTGDLLRPGCGIDPDDVGPVGQVWHCAASLRYENRYLEEIRATNVDGTRHVLALAERLGAEAFNYVSTAYVAGRRTGAIPEQAVEDLATNNGYEQSKIEAERLVSAAPGMRVRIFRPSVVVGHSETLAATTFSGFYGFLRQLVQFKGMVDRTQQGLLARTPLRIRLDADARINLVPVDAVAEEAVRIGLADEATGIFHLTSARPPTVGLAVRTLFSIVDLHEPRFVDTPEAFEWLDARFDERLDFYGSYIRGDKQFERARTDAALGGIAGPEVTYDGERLASMGRWYLELLSQERRRLPVAR
ncbi:MAG: SDR family oxidoreductase [Myxococcota bacterium]